MTYYPLPKQTYITSGFMEYRGNRFHAGVDFGTHMKEGLPVIAPENGEIYHIRVSIGGYGKALYLQGQSGRIYVFGHLSKFRKDVNDYVKNEQFSDYKYEQSLYFSDKFMVTKNEIIGYTGSTGIGNPHLHFEVRSSNNRPINPFKYFSLNDTISPIIDSIILIPVNDTSLVNGLPIPTVVHRNEKVNLWGKAGIIIFCKDYIDNKRYKTIPYTIGKIKLDSFDYANNNKAAWIFFNKFRNIGVRTYYLNDFPLKSIILDSKHSFKVKIVVKDYSGNRNNFAFKIKKSRKLIKTYVFPDTTCMYENGIIHICMDKGGKKVFSKTSGIKLVKIFKSKKKYHIYGVPLGGEFRIGQFIDTIYVLTRDIFELQEGRFNISLGKMSLRERVLAKIGHTYNSLNIRFSDFPFEKSLRIEIRNRRKYEIICNKWNNRFLGVSKAYINRNTSVFIDKDSIPPYIDRVIIVDDTIFVKIKDNKSGVNFSTISAEYEGIKLVPFPHKNKVKLISKYKLPSKGVFHLKCKDRAGNKLLYKSSIYR